MALASSSCATAWMEKRSRRVISESASSARGVGGYSWATVNSESGARVGAVTVVWAMGFDAVICRAACGLRQREHQRDVDTLAARDANADAEPVHGPADGLGDAQADRNAGRDVGAAADGMGGLVLPAVCGRRGGTGIGTRHRASARRRR